MARTLDEQLSDVDAAIAAIETGGQEAEMGESRLRQANLETLYKRRDQLQARIDRASRTGGGIRVRGGVPT